MTWGLAADFVMVVVWFILAADTVSTVTCQGGKWGGGQWLLIDKNGKELAVTAFDVQ